MKLRDYQTHVIRDTYAFFRQGIKSALLYAPTGSGKTAIACRMINDCIRKGRRALLGKTVTYSSVGKCRHKCRQVKRRFCKYFSQF